MGPSLQETSVEEDTQRVAAQLQLREYGAFVEEYGRQLRLVADAVRHRWSFPHRNYVRLEADAREQLESVHDLVNSENKIIDKVVAIFCKLCDEVAFIERAAERELLDPIRRYGEGAAEDAPPEDCQLLVSEMLPTLQRVSDLVAHCERVLDSLLGQLSAFYRLHFEITDANLGTVFDATAGLLLTVLTLEETLASNQTLAYHWTLYRRTVQLASRDASFQPARVRQLNKLAERLEGRLLSGKMVESLLRSGSECRLQIKRNKRLEEESATYLRGSR